MPASRRDHLVETALTLFCRDGFHATGVDRILAESGVAKMTMYKHFRSKDELILATLRRRDELFRNWFMRAVERRAETQRGRLVALFDALEEWFDGGDFTGCMFINASAEFSRSDDPIHAASAEHKRLMLAYVRGLAEAAGADDPDALAYGLTLLAEGAIVMAYVAGDRRAARHAKEAAGTLIEASLPAA
jgi:AcrR family transcriptional regulator